MRTLFLRSIIFFLLVVVLTVSPTQVFAALNETQIQAILGILKSFDVDTQKVSDVENALREKSVSSGSSSGVPTTFAASITKNLRLGSNGSVVCTLQEFLRHTSDYTNDVTCRYEKTTEDAVKRYQERKGIVSSGTPETTGYGAVGPRTRAAINAQGMVTASSASTSTATSTVSSQPVPAVTAQLIEPPVINRILSFGTSGEDVRRLQLYLQQTGDYTYGSITGFFGKATEDAVKKYQERKNITTPGASGYGAVGPATQSSLAHNPDPAPTDLTNTSTSVGAPSVSDSSAPMRIGITASPGTVTEGKSTLITWTSENAQSCTVTGLGFSNVTGVTGSKYTDPLPASALYILTCEHASGGRAQAKVIVTVHAPQIPTWSEGGTVTQDPAAPITSAPPTTSSAPGPKVTLSGFPAAVVAGGTVTLTWSATNATSCTGTNLNTNGATSGTRSVVISTHTQFTVTCTGNGTATTQVNVSVSGTVPTPPATPTTPPTTDSSQSGTLSTVRINSGGGAFTDSSGNAWSADYGYQGGTAVDRGAISIGNTNDDALYQTERWGLSGYSIPVVNGTYTVKLHFAETYTSITAPGQRIFTMNVEGTVFNSFDVFQNAGVRDQAVVKTLNVQVHDGSLSIAFTPIKEFPMINGIEIIGAGVLPPTNIPAPTTGGVPPVVNLSVSPTSITVGANAVLNWSSTNATSCAASGGWSGGKATSGSQSVSPSLNTTYTLTCTGAGGSSNTSTTITVTSSPISNHLLRLDTGNSSSFTDSAGNTWYPDQFVTGGATVDRGLAFAIHSTNDDRLYQTERYGTFSYAIPVTNGTYTVKLHFAETYAGITGSGGRVFSATVESQTLSNLDIYQEAGGRDTALIKSFTVPVSDGTLTITFTKGTSEEPTVNAIEVIGITQNAALSQQPQDTVSQPPTTPPSSSGSSATPVAPSASGSCTVYPVAAQPTLSGNGYQFPVSSTYTSSRSLSGIQTFNSIGLYWSAASGSKSSRALVRFREVGTTPWREGYPMEYDSRGVGGRPAEYRGSLVYLKPGTTYEIETVVQGTGEKATTQVATWCENFKIQKTIQVSTNSNQTSPYTIHQGGDATNGYVLYTGPATLDGKGMGGEQGNIRVNASYVIIRGLTLKNGPAYGVHLADGVHDVIIENNDISGWGRINPANGKYGIDIDAAVMSDRNHSQGQKRIIIQNNLIHHPRPDTNDWSEYHAGNTGNEPSSCAGTQVSCHPEGPHGITLFGGTNSGNHVIRYNKIYSDDQHKFNDAMGEPGNFEYDGFPNADTDINNNYIDNTWDDGIESEGANRNVRIYENFIGRTYQAIALTPVAVGPVYVFKNVIGKGEFVSTRSGVSNSGHAFKMDRQYNVASCGLAYIFNTTIMKPSASEGRRTGIISVTSLNPLSYTTRNNILEVFESALSPAGCQSDTAGDIFSAQYDSSHTSGPHTLQAGSSGQDSCRVLPNFTDVFYGSAPDCGAQERGATPLKFGL